jgi:hypothetical protein
MDKAAEAIPLVMNAWYHAGAANVALELITNVEDPDRRRGLAALFTAPPDLLDWAAFSLGARSAMSTLDLCAAAAWHLSDGQPLKGGKEPTLSSAFDLRVQLTPGPLRDWLVRAHESAEVSPIQTFRHGFTHRLVARHLKIRLVLQPHLLFASVVVCAPGTGLMASTPPRPGQHEARPDRGGPHQRHQQPADLGHRQGEQAEGAVQAAVSPFVRLGLVAWARVTARNAWASRARVMWRYQPGHLRTS